MTARALYRISAVMFVLFAVGHTAGFLRFHPASPEGLAVQESMSSVHFNFGGASVTWADLYTAW